ncbi:hypothetical protein CDV55_106522 [Aspergillus turcosus]|nr:hypothetical protein CDV55_106522 [Aspergillus turcosus]
MVDKTCLYVHNGTVIQLDARWQPLFSRPNPRWKLLIELPDCEHKSSRDLQLPPLERGTIHCALHPGMVINDSLSSALRRLKMRYIDGINFVSTHSQFCLSLVFIYCYLPNLYPSIKGSGNSESDALQQTSWTALDAILTLLQKHFRLCRNINLVLRRDHRTPPFEAPESLRGAVMAKLEQILQRTDEFYRAIAPKGVKFAVYPSIAAFELYLAQAKENGGVFKEGNWDLRDGESRVWRSVQLSCSEEEKRASYAAPSVEEKDRGPGYWVKTHVIDWLEQEEMTFV